MNRYEVLHQHHSAGCFLIMVGDNICLVGRLTNNTTEWKFHLSVDGTQYRSETIQRYITDLQIAARIISALERHIQIQRDEHLQLQRLESVVVYPETGYELRFTVK